MGIENIGAAIRTAREKAGLTQSQLSEGICTPLSLSRIETNRAGVRPEVFQLLMQRTGQNCSIYPAFKNRNAFLAYMALEDAAYVLETGNPALAEEYLKKIQDWYSVLEDGQLTQRFGMLQVKMQLMMENCDYGMLLKKTEQLIRLSCQDFWIGKELSGLLSITELELLLNCCEILTAVGRTEECIAYSEFITDYLRQKRISFREKNHYMAVAAIRHCDALLLKGQDVTDFVRELEKLYDECTKTQTSAILPQLYFRIGLCYHRLKRDGAYRIMRISYLAERARCSVYSVSMYRYADKILGKEFLDDVERGRVLSVPVISWIPFQLERKTYDTDSGEYPYRLGDIIRDSRRVKGLTIAKLSEGLCTKSTLSKIENNESLPGKALCDALLQRLGMNGDIFYSYCDSVDFQIYELQRHCVDCVNLHTKEGNIRAEKMLDEITEIDSNKLYKQFCTSLRASILLNASVKMEECRELLQKAFCMTQPEFCEYNFGEKPFTYNELTILNKMAFTYWDEGKNIQATQLLYQILFYLEKNKYTMQMKDFIFPITMAVLCRILYREKHFGELIELEKYYKRPELLRGGSSLEKVLIYYSQALGENGYIEKALQYAQYAAALLWIGGKRKNAERFQKALKEELNMDIVL